ncbi:hypothetical protein [Salipaludibacillus aurantiacus]|uniref:Uncharacterized protein n=1 Tax=Salipaludibacillus aurantiacus TaxID=1601833 RepID=A0A1H9SDS9_9BACI|nr:hypothetical protein [Salipaludibacillus aurantiacus]SER82523.1 hypothetical protein SAMN05518684_104141 [Salipaludibacillus aurantiacus]
MRSMRKKETNKVSPEVERTTAPGIDEEEEFGEDATEDERRKGDSTKVTRLIYDEYDPS